MNLKSLILTAAVCCLPVLSLAQTTPEAPATITTERQTTVTQADGGDNPRLRPAPRTPPPPEGTVWPNKAGDLGGATSHTQVMPTNVEGLIEMRRPFTNRPEWRGAWVTRFDWAGRRGDSFDPEAGKQRIIEAMDKAKALRLNAIVFQVRGDATTLYPSELEPWSQMVGGKDPGFDPLKLAIEEAHKRGLEFHAYINPIPCTEERTTGPASRDHVFYRHCLPHHEPNWLVHKNGEIAPSDGYKWFNPNLPEVQTYIRRVVRDLVTRYDVDGVHYDRIRLPSPDVSDDRWSKERFAGAGNPHKLEYGSWQAENLTRLINDLYGEIMEIKPHIKVTGAVWGIYDNTILPQGEDRAIGYSWTSSGLQDYAQDTIAWINMGAMDALIPMMYWSMGDLKPDYDELLANFMELVQNGRHVYGGQSVFPKEEMLRQVVATNLIGAQGTCPFTLRSISRDGMREFYQEHIFPTDAKVPEMHWKTAPTHGHVIATVLAKNGKHVRDAHVKLEGRDFIYLSTTEGTCSILDIVPGKVELTAILGDAKASPQKVTVEAGKVARVQLKLP